jgi:hypothetical protein
MADKKGEETDRFHSAAASLAGFIGWLATQNPESVAFSENGLVADYLRSVSGADEVFIESSSQVATLSRAGRVGSGYFSEDIDRYLPLTLRFFRDFEAKNQAKGGPITAAQALDWLSNPKLQQIEAKEKES